MYYFDHAATSYPKPERVIEGVMEGLRDFGANPGRSGHRMALNAGREIFKTREKLCKLFNCGDPKQIVFTSNATEALNLGIKGLLKEGDHVITSSMEHNSVIRPIKELERKGVQSTIIPCDSQGFLDTGKLKKGIKENTKLIVLTHSSNLTGTLMPIKEVGEIANEHDVRFMVDAAQTAGLYPIDVKEMKIDLLAAPGHKALLGPQGTGFLYIREGVVLEPLYVGGTGSKSQELEQPKMMPDRFESGTPNTPGIVGLGRGVDYIMEKGQENLRAHEEAMTGLFLKGIKELPFVKIYGPCDEKKQSPVVAINIREMDSSEIAYILDQGFEIGVRPGLHCTPLAHKTIGTTDQGVVRFSFGYSTKKTDIEYAVNALRTIGDEL